MDTHVGSALIIDYDHTDRALCRVSLEQLGYAVELAEPAAQRALAANSAYDLVVIDARLATPGNRELLAHASKQNQPAVIVLVDQDTVASASGFYDAFVLAKPFSQDAFSAAVMSVWQSRHVGLYARQAQQLAQAEKIAGMSRLSASIAHEINNPLQALQSSLKLLTERPLAEGKREQILQMANEQVGRLVGVVQQMMDLHRPATYDGLRPISLHELLEAVLVLLEPRLQNHGIVIERDWESALPRVRGVSSQLKQVFGSLVVNAIEAMPQGGRLTVRTRRVDDKGETQVQIEVTDTGKGISDQDLPHVFEPFFSTRAAHTGLGLATSYSIVEQHAGAISAESSIHGATFRVLLPALS